MRKVARNQRSRCVVCRRMFTHKRTGALYCGDACRKRAYRDRQELNTQRDVDDLLMTLLVDPDLEALLG